jgi:putative membrane protein
MRLLHGFHDMAGGYALSVHMAQHMFVALVLAPLLLLCVPSQVARKAATGAVVRRLLGVLRRRRLTWLIGIAAMWFWQLSIIGEGAMRRPALHTVESVCFLLTGTIFWWPIASPLRRERMEPVPWAVLYLFSACLGCTVLGILIAFAQPGMGHTQPVDQQISGLVMWVGGCFVYLSAIMAMFARWYNTSEETVPAFAPDRIGIREVSSVE